MAFPCTFTRLHTCTGEATHYCECEVFDHARWRVCSDTHVIESLPFHRKTAVIAGHWVYPMDYEVPTLQNKPIATRPEFCHTAAVLVAQERMQAAQAAIAAKQHSAKKAA